jgi:hypothetical protein
LTTTRCPDDTLLADLAADDLAPDEALADHLSTCPDCRRRLGSIRAFVAGVRLISSIEEHEQEPAPAPEPSSPTSIGTYFVVGLLRARAGWSVLRGVHAMIHGDEVAIYLADAPSIESDEGRRAVETSCAMLSRLDHPRIARAIDVGVFEGRPYLVFNHVPETALERLLEDGPFTPVMAAKLAAELGRMLATAHRAGIFHGGLTVDSVAIDREGRPRIVDFGSSLLLPAPFVVPTAAVDVAALAALIRRLTAGSPNDPRLEALCEAAPLTGADDFANGLDRLYRRRPLLWVLVAGVILAVLVGLGIAMYGHS